MQVYVFILYASSPSPPKKKSFLMWKLLKEVAFPSAALLVSPNTRVNSELQQVTLDVAFFDFKVGDADSSQQRPWLMAGSFNEILYIFLLMGSAGRCLSAAHFVASPRRESSLWGCPLRETTGKGSAVHVFWAGKEQSRLRGAAFPDPWGFSPSGKGSRRDKGCLHREGWSYTP